MTLKIKNINTAINCPSDVAYKYIVNPQNLPQWARGLSGSIKEINGEWIAESPMGKVKIKFADKNQYGVADHDVTLESGVTFHNPMRVIPNDQGCEIIFTLFQLPGVSDEKFSVDAQWVQDDLDKLKSILE